jgi:uncharacterized protein YdaT
MVAAEDSIRIIRNFIEKNNVSYVEARTIPVDTTEAFPWIRLHMQSDLSGLFPKSFVIKKDILDDYASTITASSTKNVAYYHVFFARKTAGNPSSTTLVIEAVDQTGKHILKDKDGKKVKVLEHVIPCPTCLDGAVQITQEYGTE